MTDVSDNETPGLVERARRSHLWDGVRAHDDAASALDARTLALFARLHEAQMDDADCIVREIRKAARRTIITADTFLVFGDPATNAYLPDEIVQRGSWIIRNVFAVPDVSASGNLSVVVSGLPQGIDWTLQAPTAFPIELDRLVKPTAYNAIRLHLADGVAGDKCLVSFTFEQIG